MCRVINWNEQSRSKSKSSEYTGEVQNTSSKRSISTLSHIKKYNNHLRRNKPKYVTVSVNKSKLRFYNFWNILENYDPPRQIIKSKSKSTLKSNFSLPSASSRVLELSKPRNSNADLKESIVYNMPMIDNHANLKDNNLSSIVMRKPILRKNPKNLLRVKHLKGSILGKSITPGDNNESEYK